MVFALVLAILLFFLAQYIPLGTKLLYNHLLIVFFFFVFGYFVEYKFGALSTLILFVFLTIILVNDDSFYWTHFFQFGLMFIGTLFGSFVHLKKVYLSILCFALLITLLFFSYYHHSNPEYSVQNGYSIEQMNMNCKSLTDHSGNNPVFNLDTVYLVNFGFVNCSPCRIKKKSLKRLANKYSNDAFKIVEIHCFEDIEIFRKNDFNHFANSYHDSLDLFTKYMNIDSAPTELIFNKKGNMIRSFSGFNFDLKSNYESTTINLINSLIHEN